MALPGLPKQVNMPRSSNSVNGLRMSLSNASRATSFGIGAQRTHRGSIFNSNYISYQGVRAQLNGGGRVVVNNHGSMNRADNNPYAELMKYQMMMQMGTQVATGIADIVKAFKSDGSGGTEKASTTTSTNKTTSTSSSSSSSVISNMQNAQDSTTLSAALEKAKHEQTDLSTGGKIDAAKDELAKLKGETQGLEQKKAQTANELEAHNNEVKAKENDVTARENAVKSCSERYNAAETAYKNCPEYITGPDGTTQVQNPEKAKLKAQMETEKTKLDAANEQLDAANKELADLKAKTDEYKTKADKAEEAFEKNKKDIETKEKAIETMEKTKKDLDTEIPKQTKRLKELQEKDEKALKQIEKELDNINKDMEKTKDDKKKTQLEQKQEDFKARQKDIKKRQAIMNKNNIVQQDFVNGQQYKKVSTPDGNIYLIDGKEVSENFYNDQYNKYKTENA